jgi:hypothetical protein
MTRSIGLPRPVEPHGPQVEHCLRAHRGPTQARLLHPIVHEVPTGAFNHPRANPPTPGQVLVGAHTWPVALIGAHGPLHYLPLCCRRRRLVSLGLQGGSHRVRRSADCPLAQSVGSTPHWQVQRRRERAAAVRPWRGKVMPPTPHAAEDRVVGAGALIMRRQARAVRCQDGLGGVPPRA